MLDKIKNIAGNIWNTIKRKVKERSTISGLIGIIAFVFIAIAIFNDPEKIFNTIANSAEAISGAIIGIVSLYQIIRKEITEIDG